MSAMPTSEAIEQRPAGTGWTWIEQRWLLATLYAALTAIALYPVFSVTVPPLVDYPNHLARMHILAHWDNVPELQRNYVTDWKLHPNMAMDLIVPLLAKVMPIYMAGKLFIAATLLMLLGGTMALRKVLYGRVGLWPMLTFLVLYNHVLFWGFLNYLFTAGLALFAFSGWVALREQSRPLRIAVFAVATATLYAGHLFGLLVYGILVLGYEIQRCKSYRLRGRDAVLAWSVTGAQFIAPTIFLWLWMSQSDASGNTVTEYGSLASKAAALMSPVHFGMPWIDVLSAVFLAMIFVFCRSNRRIGFAAELKLPLLLMAFAAIVMPNYLFGVWGTDLRLPTILACLLIAGTKCASLPRRQLVLLVAASVGVFIVRTGAIAYHWSQWDERTAELRQSLQVITPGAKLLTLSDRDDMPPAHPPLYHRQTWHIAALGIIERSVFLSTLFTEHTAIRAHPDLRKLDTPVGNPISRKMLETSADPKPRSSKLGFQNSRYFRFYWIGWPEKFDYLLVIRFEEMASPDAQRLQLVHRGSFFDIYRILDTSHG
jgi:hypothetical protein